MVFTFINSFSRKGRSLGFKARDSPGKHIFGVTHRMKRNLPHFVTSWLNLSGSTFVDHQNFQLGCVETSQNVVFGPADFMIRQMIPLTSSPTVPVYRNLKIPQHYQYEFQYTQAMAIKFETRIQKFIVREPPCYSHESKGQYSETAPYGLSFVNDEIAASTFVTTGSGMLEWQVMLTVERNWYSKEFDAEVMLSCSHPDLKAIYAGVELSLLDDDGEVACKKSNDYYSKYDMTTESSVLPNFFVRVPEGANCLHAIHSGTPTTFHVPGAFLEQDLRYLGITQDLSYFFRVAIHSAIFPTSQEKPLTRCDEDDKKAPGAINFIREDISEVVNAIDGDVAVPAYTFEADAKQYLKNFTVSSVQAMLRHVHGASQDELNKMEWTELLQSFHLAYKFELPTFLAECKRNMILHLNLQKLHQLLVLAFVYCNDDIRFTCHIRALLIENLGSVKKSQDFIKYLRRYPLAFVNALLCTVNGMNTE